MPEIRVPYNGAQSILVDGVCYHLQEVTTGEITHLAVDGEFEDCVDCQDYLIDREEGNNEIPKYPPGEGNTGIPCPSSSIPPESSSLPSSSPSSSSSAPLWTPSEVSTIIWLDADDASTISDTGGLVDQWNDKSGNAAHAIPPAPVNRPRTGAVNIGGLNTVDGDGGGKLMICTLPAPVSISGVLYVYQVRQVTNVPPNGGMIFDINTFATGNFNRLTDVGEALARYVGGVADSSPTTLPTPPIGDRLIASRYSNPSSLLERFVDGDNSTPNASYTFALNPPFSAGDTVDSFWLFCDSTANDDVTGGIGEVIAVSGAALGPGDEQKMEGYLAWKWGLEGNLPVSHPYKLAPPTV
jgi:hypothetical protein